MKILTWHVHGSYLLYLTRFSKHHFYLPVDETGAGGRGNVFPFADNVIEIAADNVRRARFDCILFQNKKNWNEDQHQILASDQKKLPRIYLEHDPPLEHPTEQLHAVADEKDVLLVHVTPFNALMWNSGNAVTRVIEHGAFLSSDVEATYELERGITAINNISTRGRRAGADVFDHLRESGLPLDLVGMNAKAIGGLGEVTPPELAKFIARYRFYFNPSRYTSLNLAVIEAMLVGLPIIGLATTEMTNVIQNGRSGYTDTDPKQLVEPMRELLNDPRRACELGKNAKLLAHERFDIHRFTRDWNYTFTFATGIGHVQASVA